MHEAIQARLRLVSSDHATPGVAAEPQEVINRALSDADIFIGIMWGRFGTPTHSFGSGTEEEFHRALSRFKDDSDSVQIMMYFKESALPYDQTDGCQLARVKEFRKSLNNLGVLYSRFESTEDFKSNLRKHLSKKIAEIRQKMTNLMAVGNLSAASGRHSGSDKQANIRAIVDSVQTAATARRSEISNWRNQVLWVDDRPENNTYEREAFESIGLRLTLALSTDEAFEKLSENEYSVIISDMGRREGPREGYVLLDRLRKEGDRTPLFFYAASNAPEHIKETIEHGGQGCTNNPRDLFEMVTKAVIKGSGREEPFGRTVYEKDPTP